MIVFDRFSKLFNVLGQIAAFLTVILIGFIYFNEGVVKVVSADTLNVLKSIKEYAVLGTLVIVGLAFASKRPLLIFVLYCLLAALAIGFSFPALF